MMIPMYLGIITHGWGVWWLMLIASAVLFFPRCLSQFECWKITNSTFCALCCTVEFHCKCICCEYGCDLLRLSLFMPQFFLCCSCGLCHCWGYQECDGVKISVTINVNVSQTLLVYYHVFPWVRFLFFLNMIFCCCCFLFVVVVVSSKSHQTAEPDRHRVKSLILCLHLKVICDL